LRILLCDHVVEDRFGRWVADGRGTIGLEGLAVKLAHEAEGKEAGKVALVLVQAARVGHERVLGLPLGVVSSGPVDAEEGVRVWRCAYR
jgi:hypothetical protein